MIVSDFGYHAGTQTYLHSDGTFPPLTVIHSKEEAVRIARRLIEPYVDFNFFNEHGTPNYHEAMALTMILMSVLRATVVCPVLLVTASRAGEGKTYLIRCLVAEKGERADFIAWSPDAAEAEKRLATVGLKRPSYIAIDNFDAAIGGDSLEALTDKAVNECVEIRLLGSSMMVPVYNNAFIGITGINLRPANEAMARRSMSVVLEPSAGGAAWASRKLKLPYAPAEYVLANWSERHMLALSLVAWWREQRVATDLPAFNALPDFDALNRRLVWSLFGVDVVAGVFADAFEVAAQNDATSPKGRLCYYAWEMCRAWSRTGEQEKYWGCRGQRRATDALRNRGRTGRVHAGLDGQAGQAVVQVHHRRAQGVHPLQPPGQQRRAGCRAEVHEAVGRCRLLQRYEVRQHGGETPENPCRHVASGRYAARPAC